METPVPSAEWNGRCEQSFKRSAAAISAHPPADSADCQMAFRSEDLTPGLHTFPSSLKRVGNCCESKQNRGSSSGWHGRMYFVSRNCNSRLSRYEQQEYKTKQIETKQEKKTHPRSHTHSKLSRFITQPIQQSTTAFLHIVPAFWGKAFIPRKIVRSH